MKSNTKPWFEIDFLKKFLTFSGNEIDEGNFKCAKLLLKKVVNNMEKLYFEEKTAENTDNPNKLSWTLESLGMPSEGRGYLNY